MGDNMRKKMYLDVSVARRLLEDKKIDEAIECYRKIYEINPKNIIVRFELGRILIRNEENEQEGINMLKSLFGTKNANFALHELARHAVAKKDLDTARNYFNQLKKCGGRDKHLALIDLGKLEFSICNYDEALKCFNQLLSTEFRDNALLEIAKIDYIQGKKKQALGQFRALLYSNDVPNLAKCELAKHYFNEEDYTHAETYFKELLRSALRSEASFFLGRIQAKYGNVNRARDYFMCMKNYMDYPHIVFELARLEKSVGNFERAEELFEKLLFTDYYAGSLLEIGNIKLATKNLNEAEEIYKSLEDTDKEDTALLRLGIIEYQRNNIVKATNYFAAALDSPSMIDAIKNIINLEIKNGCYKSAQILLEKYKTQIDNYFYTIFNTIINKKLGVQQSLYNTPYHIQQIINYSKFKALKHIELHLNENNEKLIHTCFYDNIDIHELYDNVSEAISNEKYIGFSPMDKYIIDVGFPISTIDGEETSRLIAITTSNTHDIISMYPIIWYGNSIKLQPMVLKKEV